MSSLQFVLAFILALTPTTGAEDQVSKCFTQTPNTAIAQSPKAIVEIYKATAYDCLRFCVQQASAYGAECKSLVYHQHYHSCQMYSHDGTTLVMPAMRVAAYGHHLWVRTVFDSSCLSSAVVTSAPATIATTVPVSNAPTTPPPGAVCTNEEKPAYFVHVSKSLPVTETTVIVPSIDERQCSVLCGNNLNNKEEQHYCASFDFFPPNGQCNLNSERATPLGKLDLEENGLAVYAEKFCLTLEESKHCKVDETFLFYTNELIDSPEDIISNVSTTDYAECVDQCVTKVPGCKAVTYRFEGGGNNCMFFKIHLGDKPQTAKAGNPGFVIIENGCTINTQELLRQLVLTERKLQTQPIADQQEAVVKEPSRENQLIPLADGTNVLESTSTGTSGTDDSSDNNKWTSWSSCRFQVKGVAVRVRTKHCNIIDCKQDRMQVKRCRKR